jgi:hypothetical protein
MEYDYIWETQYSGYVSQQNIVGKQKHAIALITGIWQLKQPITVTAFLHFRKVRVPIDGIY